MEWFHNPGKTNLQMKQFESIHYQRFRDKNKRINDCHINIGYGKWAAIKFNFPSKSSTIYEFTGGLLERLPLLRQTDFFLAIRLVFLYRLSLYWTVLLYCQSFKDFYMRMSLQLLQGTERFKMKTR